ncbi:hypothetical protein DMUE_5295 [Dictyocoela muelleri]|nr:hypothetical protein DMUE_5295 [Dictyocoela muelleri]
MTYKMNHNNNDKNRHLSKHDNININKQYSNKYFNNYNYFSKEDSSMSCKSIIEYYLRYNRTLPTRFILNSKTQRSKENKNLEINNSGKNYLEITVLLNEQISN